MKSYNTIGYSEERKKKTVSSVIVFLSILCPIIIYAQNEPEYADFDGDEFPLSECLKDTVERFVPYWENEIAPQIRAGKRIIISAHGNSLRALVKFLDEVPDEEIVKLNIPTGIPLIYELDDALKPIRHYYLGDPEEIKKLEKAVADQGKAA